MLGGVAIFNLFNAYLRGSSTCAPKFRIVTLMLGGAHFFLLLPMLSGVAIFNVVNASTARVLLLPNRC